MNLLDIYVSYVSELEKVSKTATLLVKQPCKHYLHFGPKTLYLYDQ
jgi:hypothetical protein